jgi:hypothetical protein
LDQAVVAFHKSLEEEIKVRGHNHRLPLLFASMLEHRAEKNTNFTIPTKEKWEGIRRQVVEGKGDAKGGKLITKWGLVIRPRGGQAEAAALAGLHTAQDVVLLVDRGGRRYVHQGEVFEVLMAALLEADNMKKLKEKVDKECCNITNVVVDDFLRALDVCYYLAGVSAPAGNMRFECLCPPPCHKAYMQSKYLQNVLRSLPDADLTETAAERLKDLSARIKDCLARNTMAATANTGGIGKKRGREGAAGEGAAGEGAAGEGAADELRVRRLMGEHGISWGTVLALAEEYTNFTIPTKIKVA